MLEAIGIFFTAYLFTWPAIVGVLLFGVFCEYHEARGWAVFASIGAAALSYFYFDVELTKIIMFAVAYLVAGLVWSFWRYNLFVKKAVADIDKLYDHERNDPVRNSIREQRLERISPQHKLDTITAWIIIWPVSVVERCIGDILHLVDELVSKVFKGVYHRIYTSQTQKYTTPSEKEE